MKREASIGKKALAIFLFALVIRLLYINFSSQKAAELAPGQDSYEYHAYAVSLIEQHTYISPTGNRATRTPGYPLFLALVYSVFGVSLLAIQTVQAFLNALVCVALYYSGRRLFPESWAFLCGALGALYLDLYRGVARVLSEPLYIFFIALFFLLWLSRQENAPRFKIFLSGLCLGAATLVRPEAALFALLVSSFLFGFSRAKMIFFLLFSLGVGAMVLPWAVRNRLVLGAWIATTTRAGYNSYNTLQWPMADLGLQPERDDRQLDPSEVENDRLFRREGKRLFKETPWRVMAKLWAYNTAIFFYPFLPGFDWTFVFCLPLWVLGLRALLREHTHEGWVFLAFLGASIIAYIFLTATVSRYRETVSPACVLLAVAGLYQMSRSLNRTTFRAIVGGWLALTLAAWAGSSHLRQMAVDWKHHFW